MSIPLDEVIDRCALSQPLSDVHIQSGQVLYTRVHGRIQAVSSNSISPNEIIEFAKAHLSSELWQAWQVNRSSDANIKIRQHHYRAHFYFVSGRPAMALRKIQQQAPSLAALGMPDTVAKHLAQAGLILVTGPTGSGKSTSLAAMVAHLMHHSPGHILTIEDPIEYRFNDSGQALLSQREIGVDALSFASAMRAAMREDPDYILLGEVRESDSASMVLTAAETGHLVLTTLHASDCAQAISRLVGLFPQQQHQQVLVRLADSLKFIINQRLFLRQDQTARVAAYEVLVFNNAVRNLVRENKLFQLAGYMDTASQAGMVSMRSAIAELQRQQLISPDLSTCL